MSDVDEAAKKGKEKKLSLLEAIERVNTRKAEEERRFPALKWRPDFERVRVSTDEEPSASKAADRDTLIGFTGLAAMGLVLVTVKGGGGAWFGWVLMSLACVATIIKVALSPPYKREGILHCFCPHCGKHIGSDVVWQCGYCDQKNAGDRKIFSFLYKCEHCKAAPKSYLCHHCEQVIFLDKDQDNRHCARMFREATPEAAKPITKSRQEELEEIAFKTTRAKVLCSQMEAELALAERQWRIEQAEKERQGRSSGSELEQDFGANRKRTLEVHNIAARELKKARQDHADDPVMLQQEKMFIENWVAEKLGKVE